MLPTVVSNGHEGALTFGEVRRVAGATYGRSGLHLADLWDAYNRDYFGGKVDPVLICRSRVFAYGRCIGYTSVRSGEDPWRHIVVKAYSQNVCADQRAILLHELVHLALFQRGEDPNHGGVPWTTEIMRISELLGQELWAGRYTVIRDGKKTRRANKAPPEELAQLRRLNQDEIARWPHSVGIIPPDLNVYSQLYVDG
jgi:hypothetical protein